MNTKFCGKLENSIQAVYNHCFDKVVYAAVDLLFHSNETGASLTTRLEYGMEQ